jgi:hypothetical protein
MVRAEHMQISAPSALVALLLRNASNLRSLHVSTFHTEDSQQLDIARPRLTTISLEEICFQLPTPRLFHAVTHLSICCDWDSTPQVVGQLVAIFLQAPHIIELNLEFNARHVGAWEGMGPQTNFG